MKRNDLNDRLEQFRVDLRKAQEALDVGEAAWAASRAEKLAEIGELERHVRELEEFFAFQSHQQRPA